MSPVIRRLLLADSAQERGQHLKRVFNVREAATYAGTSIWQVRQWIHLGDLKAARIGKKDVIDRAMLDSFLDGLFQVRS